MNISYQTWDSRFFGYPVGRLELAEPTQKAESLMQEAQIAGYKLIYIFMSSSHFLNELVLNKYNGLLADTKVTYECTLRDSDGQQQPLEEYTGAGGELYELAYESGIYSRFFIDSRFGTENFQRLYRQWIDNSLGDGELANKVFIYRQGHRIVGFVTLKIDGKKASIGLIAVQQEYRKLSIGRQLIDGCKKEAFNKGCHSLSVVTQQRNAAACSFYEKNGFLKLNAMNIYHFWL